MTPISLIKGPLNSGNGSTWDPKFKTLRENPALCLFWSPLGVPSYATFALKALYSSKIDISFYPGKVK